MSLKDFAVGQARAVLNRPAVLRRRFPDFDDSTVEIIHRVTPFTMTSAQRIAAVVQAVRYVEARGIPGDFVECGVWRGGSSMAAALAFSTPRTLHLFDTFEGMSAPGDDDRRFDGAPAGALIGAAGDDDLIHCCAALDEVKGNLASTGYAGEVRYIQGRVEETLPERAPERIAILRLDTDWYASTRHELEHLYPRLAPGGVLIIDDYGYWAGARKAVDEYFGGRMLLNRIDRTGRICVKPDVAAAA